MGCSVGDAVTASADGEELSRETSFTIAFVGVDGAKDAPRMGVNPTRPTIGQSNSYFAYAIITLFLARRMVACPRAWGRAMTYAGRFVAIAAIAACFAAADAVPVRYAQAYLHGFLVLEDLEGKTLASGEATQVPVAGRVTMTLRLHFRDGSLHEEIAVFSERRSFQLLSYKEVQRGPSFKQPLTLSFDASGKATVVYTGKDGAERTNSAQLNLPEDVSNGILPMLMCNLVPRVENTLSMVVAAPKPEVVKLKIDPAAEATFTVGGVSAKANHFVVHIDLGALRGTVAKVVGKQPPPTDMWIASGNAPVFLKSEGPLYEDGPIWRIRLASPAWGRSGRGPGD